MFEKAGLRIWDVELLSTHGGSLRVFGCHTEDPRAETPAVGAIIREEGVSALRDLGTYRQFQRGAEAVKHELLSFLVEQKRKGKQVGAYGAAAKGNTLLNFAGVRPDLLAWVCDAAPSKQGKYLPGSHLPIFAPKILREHRPDFVIILPWNIADEILERYSYIRQWGGKFVVAVPHLRVLG